MTRSQTPRQSVRMSRHMWMLLGRETKRRGQTRSEVIRTMVTDYLTRCGVHVDELTGTTARDDR